MDTIFQNEKVCWICGKTDPLHSHHCLAGSYRNVAEKYGLKIYLCPEHHAEVHNNEKKMAYFRQLAQVMAMEYYGWSAEEFIEKIGRSFL